MAIEKKVVLNQVTVDEFDNILIRHVIRIEEDGNVISESYVRSSINKNGDLTDQPAKVIAIANAAWASE